jgi:hypothetical protein
MNPPCNARLLLAPHTNGSRDVPRWGSEFTYEVAHYRETSAETAATKKVAHYRGTSAETAAGLK